MCKLMAVVAAIRALCCKRGTSQSCCRAPTLICRRNSLASTDPAGCAPTADDDISASAGRIGTAKHYHSRVRWDRTVPVDVEDRDQRLGLPRRELQAHHLLQGADQLGTHAKPNVIKDQKHFWGRRCPALTTQVQRYQRPSLLPLWVRGRLWAAMRYNVRVWMMV